MSKVMATMMCAGLALALGACGDKAPTGQVVATVNGTEVTVNELNAELQGAQIPPGMDKKAAQKAALQRVVDRKLLAQAAAEKGLDKTPDYLAQKQKLDETILAQAFVKQQASIVGNPTDSDVQKFMADNPNIFAGRQRLAVDQIRFALPKDQSVLKAMESVHTQDGVADLLRQRNVPFERGPAAIDTAVLPAQVVNQIKGMPAGEPFVLPAQGGLTINVVTGQTAAPIPVDQARQLATAGWKERQFGTTIKNRLDALKKSAKITYQPGYEPPAPGKAGAAPAPAAS